MENGANNVFDYKSNNKINSNIKEKLKNNQLIPKRQTIKYNQRHLSIINLILLEITLIILPKIDRAFEHWIEIKVNEIGENQILSDEYTGILPSKIYVNCLN